MSHTWGLRLIVADHEPASRRELRRLLQSESGLAVVAQCATADAAVRLSEQHRPDVLLLDLSLPEKSGFAALHRLTELKQPTRILGLSTSAEQSVIVEALTHGARGVVQKNAPRAVLVDSIRTAARNEYWVSPGHLALIVEALRTYRPVLNPLSDAQVTTERLRYGLTRRELDIVAGITTGESNKEIAERLALAECTVKHHLASVYDKLGVFSRLQLALFAIHHHLVNVAEFFP